MASTSLESVDALSGMNGKVDCIAYLNLVSEPGAVATGSNNSTGATIRSHPPPHAGCPRGDPGPLPVLTRFFTVGLLPRFDEPARHRCSAAQDQQHPGDQHYRHAARDSHNVHHDRAVLS